MPEIVRNLTIARFLWRLGTKIWLYGFRLDSSNQYAIIIMNFLNDDVNFMRRLHVYPFHDLALERGSFCYSCVFADKYFPLLFSHMSILKLKQPIAFINFSYAKIACTICCFKL